MQFACNRHRHAWSTYEDEILMKHYPTGGTSRVAPLLTRTVKAIQRRATELGLEAGAESRHRLGGAREVCPTLDEIRRAAAEIRRENEERERNAPEPKPEPVIPRVYRVVFR